MFPFDFPTYISSFAGRTAPIELEAPGDFPEESSGHFAVYKDAGAAEFRMTVVENVLHAAGDFEIFPGAPGHGNIRAEHRRRCAGCRTAAGTLNVIQRAVELQISHDVVIRMELELIFRRAVF